MDLLRSKGYEVDYQPPTGLGAGYWQTLDDAKLAKLGAADLVIVGRDTNTGAYANDATEVGQWNGVKTPVILMNAYMARSNRWLWVNSTDIGSRQACFTAKAVDSSHQVFAGVTLGAGGQVTWLNSAVSPAFSTYINTTGAGNGHVIAARPDNNYVLIVEWDAGTPFYAGSTQTPADNRMFFCAGTEQTSGTNIGYGVYDLTSQGQAMFLNAVAYMLGETQQPQPVSQDATLVGWWKLDEGSGTMAYDSSGWGNEGTLYGGLQWVTGEVGGALQFDGVDDYVDCGNGPGFNITKEITVAAWVKTVDAGGGQRNTQMIGKGGSGYYLEQAKWDSGEHLVQFMIHDGDYYGAGTFVTSSFDGQWHHLAGTYDGTRVKFYVDGQLKTTTDHAGHIDASTANLNIGRVSDWPGNCFPGTIDNARIYNRALSNDEIAGIAGVVRPTPIGWWKLDEGSGSIAHDSSGRHVDGMISNQTGGLGVNGTSGSTTHGKGQS